MLSSEGGELYNDSYMRKQNWPALILAFIIGVLAATIWYIAHTFPETKIDTMLFYLANGAEAASDQTVLRAVQQSWWVFALVFLMLGLLVYRPTPHDRFKGNKYLRWAPLEKIGKVKISYIYAGLLLVIVFSGVHYFGATDYIIARYFQKTKIYETHYVRPGDVDITFPDEKRNLVMIFAESIENTVLSRTNGGGSKYSLMPELEQLALNNVNFSNTSRLGGAQITTNARNTTTGIVSQTSGTPLVIGSDISLNNNFNNYKNYLPGLENLGDILHKQGYNQKFVLGSDSNFGNRKTYFAQHGSISIFDYPEAKKQHDIPSDYHVWWGYEDKKMFNFARQASTELASLDEPFALTLLTVDTHFVDGWLDPSCRDINLPTQYENVHACSSRMIGQFVGWLQQQPYYNNTEIVIVGDHLGMQTDFYESRMPQNYTRTVYNAFINATQKPEKEKNRTFNSFDIFPTTLAGMGVEIQGNRLGFGTNLFSDRNTVAEQIGLDTFNAELGKHSNYYQSCILSNKCPSK